VVITVARGCAACWEHRHISVQCSCQECAVCAALQALFKLPTEIIAAAMNVTPAQAAGVAETAATQNIYPGAVPFGWQHTVTCCWRLRC
jgi:hypothetical protein